MCYTAEMQQQAAPHKFKGHHPFINNIPSQYIPPELIEPIERYNTDLTITAEQAVTKYPKLLMTLRDPEIIKLSTRLVANKNGRDIFRQLNQMWLAPTELFDDIDCKDIKCTCDLLGHFDYEQVYGPHENYDNETVILYRTCKRTLFAAAKRQVKSAPVPDEHVASDFIQFAKSKIEKYLGSYLDSFGYSYNQWYNHLNSSKQKAIKSAVAEFNQYPDFSVMMERLKDPHYRKTREAQKYLKMFHYEAICKKELQDKDGKPRMVCSIPTLVKYVMGPVCWALEEIFSKELPCYSGAMNLTQMQDKINHYIDDGFTIIAEGDGSAFDNTQDVSLKEIDRYVYRRIADKVYHVPKDLFLYCSQQYYKIMDVVHCDPLSKKKETLFTYAVLGTVFSGDCDTTLMNTTRMGLYNWYTNEQAGLTFGNDFICFSKGDDFTCMYQNIINQELVRLAYKKYWLAKNKPKDPTGPEYDARQFGLGQILKFIEFGDPSTIKFCSLRAWFMSYQNDRVYLTRNPAKFQTLSQFSRKTRFLKNDEVAAYLFDQAIALKTSYDGIKWFDTMFRIYIEAAKSFGNYNLVRLKMFLKNRRADEKSLSNRRETLVLEVNQGLDWESRFYNKKPREEYHYILENESYWTSIKKAYNQQLYKPTADELNHINNEIYGEFDHDLLYLDMH